MKLEGKIALVTGGNSGIGLATAKLFANEGAYVYITGRDQSKLDSAVREGNSAIAAHVEADPELEGMGTTLTAILFDGNRLGLVHIGDSRGYLLRDG